MSDVAESAEANLEAPPEPAPTKPVASRHTRSVIEWVLVVVGALLVALLIRTFLFSAYFIPSPSMEPTLKIHDRVLVNKLSYKLHDVHRGDVIVFSPPASFSDKTVKDLIKRVVGLPGETIEAIDGVVYINGHALHEPYLPTGTRTENLPATKVPADAVFVMGDNRSNSHDSRYPDVGPIPLHLVVGRAFVTIWPLGHLGWL
jgi:signal peptidase I